MPGLQRRIQKGTDAYWNVCHYFSMLHIESGVTFSDSPPPAPVSRQSGVTFLLAKLPPKRSGLTAGAGIASVRGYFLTRKAAAEAARVRGYFSLAGPGRREAVWLLGCGCSRGRTVAGYWQWLLKGPEHDALI